MFTGIIEDVCTIKSVKGSPDTGPIQLMIDLGKYASDCKIGDSIAVSGVCLTVAGLQGSVALFDVSAETISKSTFGQLKPNSKVNIERALLENGRFGGHFVLGHTDGTASIKKIEKKGQFINTTFAAKKKLLDNIVAKGSIAIDGISLTVARLDDESFSVNLIPETLKKTTFRAIKTGNKVNIETDIIIKTINKYIKKILTKEQNLTVEKLKQLGF